MIPKTHPRYPSLKTRELIVKGVKAGIASIDGLIAQGRGEAFDYMLGEKTNEFARKSIEAAAALLLLAKKPVISVNGNCASLVPKDIASLANVLCCPLEVNIFHASKRREQKIKGHLIKNDAKNVLLPNKNYKIDFLDSNRRYVNPNGIFQADVVFVPLEDGDRAEALINNGKKVVTIDLNPMSRTARKSTITIVDNIVRAIPLLIENIGKLKNSKEKELKKILDIYDNKQALAEALSVIKK